MIQDANIDAKIDRAHYDKDVRYHDSIATEYDQVVVEPRRYFNDKLFARCRRFVPRGNLMLDLGCGTGHASLRFADKFRKVIAVDHSEGMQEVARRNLTAAGIDNVEFANANVLEYVRGLEPRSAAAVICIGFLHHLRPDDHTQLLEGIAMALRPGGTLLISEPLQVDSEPPARISAWNSRSIAAGQGYSHSEPEADEVFLNRQRLLDRLHAAGFAIAKTFQHWEIFPHSTAPGLVEAARMGALNLIYGANGNVFTVIAKRRSQ